MHTCVSVYVYVYDERERISGTLITTAALAQGCESDLCMCAHAHVGWYYFANLSTVSSNDRKSFICTAGGNTITHPHKHTHQGTHVIFGMVHWLTNRTCTCRDHSHTLEYLDVCACVGV